MTITSDIRQMAADLEQQLDDLNTREQQVAAAAELLSQSVAVQAAWAGGQQHERQRIQSLIDIQLDQLSRGGVNAISLSTLRQRINDRPLTDPSTRSVS